MITQLPVVSDNKKVPVLTRQSYFRAVCSQDTKPAGKQDSPPLLKLLLSKNLTASQPTTSDSELF